MQGMTKVKRFCLRVFFIAVLSAVNLAFVSMSAAQGSASCDAAAAPAAIGELLKERFAEWRPKQVSDMEADEQELWLKGSNGKECPGIAVGHFESTDSLSYAFLLDPLSNPCGGHKIVVYS